jgi:tRNA G10  N-methylase Trm11
MYKLEFLKGLEDFVESELKEKTKEFSIYHKSEGIIYLNTSDDKALKELKSVNNAYECVIDRNLNPKQLAGNLNKIESVLEKFKGDSDFTSFNIDISGHQTNESLRIREYISSFLNISESNTPDLQINYGKKPFIGWDISFRLSPRPLSKRTWKIGNIEGGLNPTIAYCMNTLTKPNERQRYLNIFAGSGTLLIERLAWGYRELIGFDNNGANISSAYQNIRAANCKDIKIENHDIYGSPDFGLFDVIIGDIPFGAQIGSESNLKSLYSHILNYCSNSIARGGVVVLFTSQRELLESMVEKSKKFYLKDRFDVELNTTNEDIRNCSIYLLQCINV